MKFLRNMVFVFLLGINSLAFADGLPSYILKIPKKYSSLQKSLILILEMPDVPQSYQEGIRLFLEKWSRSIVKLNHLSAKTFKEGLTPNLLNLILFTQEELKNQAIEFIPKADLTVNSVFREYQILSDSKSQPSDQEFMSGFNAWKIENTLAKWLKEQFIDRASQAILSPQEQYLIWSFVESLFPYKKNSPHFVAKDPNDIRPDYSFIFDYIEEYVTSFQSGGSTETFKVYAESSEIDDPQRPLSQDEKAFLEKFYGIERFIKIIKKKNQSSPKKL